MQFITTAALLLFLATSLGALGAHALEPRLSAAGHLHTWSTAVLYHLVHGLAMLAVAIWQRLDPIAAASRTVGVVQWLWLLGMICFSGSLYALSLGGPRWLGPVTPLGGVLFLGGWLVLAFAAVRLGSAAPGTG